MYWWFSCCHRLFAQKHAVAPVAETFAGAAFLGEAHEHGTQFGFQFGFLDHVLPDAVQARAGGVAAEPDLIASGRLAA